MGGGSMSQDEAGLYVRIWGDGEPVVLLHGSQPPDREVMWAEQRRVLSDRYRLLVPDRRGYGASPDGQREDFEVEVRDIVRLLGTGAHLVGFSYGGLISLFAAAQHPEAISSLTVIEPPLFAVAQGHPAVDRIIAALNAMYDADPELTPEEFRRAFAEMWDDEQHELPVLTPEQRRATRRMMAERNPARIVAPLEELRAAQFPKLVLSGESDASVEILCDTLAQRIGAQRVVVPGAHHGVRHPGVTAALATFLDQAGRPTLP
jgi:pimeloyl-ACP methyl ester carboxylesterase